MKGETNVTKILAQKFYCICRTSKTKINIQLIINQIQIPKSGKSQRVAVW